mmetsp:Transcript_77095/g.208271  ORF Transcript_77095/g.208271 Transcript_77095/m.208271 type:complete len:308 (+) Transcript_77095:1-924(+)
MRAPTDRDAAARSPGSDLNAFLGVELEQRGLADGAVLRVGLQPLFLLQIDRVRAGVQKVPHLGVDVLSVLVPGHLVQGRVILALPSPHAAQDELISPLGALDEADPVRLAELHPRVRLAGRLVDHALLDAAVKPAEGRLAQGDVLRELVHAHHHGQGRVEHPVLVGVKVVPNDAEALLCGVQAALLSFLLLAPHAHGGALRAQLLLLASAEAAAQPPAADDAAAEHPRGAGARGPTKAAARTAAGETACKSTGRYGGSTVTGILRPSASCRVKNSRSLAYLATSPANFATFGGVFGVWASSSAVWRV